MQIEIRVRIAGTAGVIAEDEVLKLEKPHDRLETIGLSLTEAKDLLSRLQERIVAAQATAFAAERRCCTRCGYRLRGKGSFPIAFRTPFGDVPLTSPRYYRCSCDPGATRTFSPLTALFTEHVAPELFYLETKWASLVSYGMTVDLLKDVLPISTTFNAETVRTHLQKIAARAEAELGEEQASFVEGWPSAWAVLAAPEGPIVVVVDGGYVRARDQDASHFEVMVGRSIPEDRESRYFGLVQSHDTKPRQRLHRLLKEQGLQMNQAITFLTDGGDTARNMALDMSSIAEHVLDWFHITMRLTVLGQYLKGLAHYTPDEAGTLERELRRIKGYLWNGNLHEAMPSIDGLIDDLEAIESDYPSLKALRKAAGEFQTYIANNADMLPNYAERRRYGERVSTAFVESTVNVVVGKRFSKRQQMRWSRHGAHLMLQTRTRALDGTLRRKFEDWYPGLATRTDAAQPHTAIAA